MKEGLRPEIIQAFHATDFSTPVIGITGGKGGVGKTTVAVNLAVAMAARGKKIALVDADVDAPNAAILLGYSLDNSEDVPVVQPLFDPEKCTDCKQCLQACRLNSLFRPKEKTILLMGECNGCEACFLVCEAGAISRGHRSVGTTYKTSGTPTLYTGALHPVLEESALVVKAVRDRAFAEADQFDCILVDTAPGTHCNVIDALQGAVHVVAVTEPTILGAHDLELMLSLLDMFAIGRSVFVNRSDMPGSVEDIRKLSTSRRAEVVAELVLDEELLESNVQGVPLVTAGPESRAAKTFAAVADNLIAEYLS